MKTQLVSVLSLCLLTSTAGLAANFSTAVGFPGAPQAPGCSKSRTDGLTDVCTATNGNGSNISYGTAAVSSYGDSGSYAIVGFIQVTRPNSTAVSVNASASATFASEFNSLSSGSVTVTNTCNSSDCEPLQVYAYGNVVATLNGGDSYTITISGQNANIQVAYSEAATSAGTDYDGIINATVVQN